MCFYFFITLLMINTCVKHLSILTKTLFSLKFMSSFYFFRDLKLSNLSRRAFSNRLLNNSRIKMIFTLFFIFYFLIFSFWLFLFLLVLFKTYLIFILKFNRCLVLKGWSLLSLIIVDDLIFIFKDILFTNK